MNQIIMIIRRLLTPVFQKISRSKHWPTFRRLLIVFLLFLVIWQPTRSYLTEYQLRKTQEELSISQAKLDWINQELLPSYKHLEKLVEQHKIEHDREIQKYFYPGSVSSLSKGSAWIETDPLGFRVVLEPRQYGTERVETSRYLIYLDDYDSLDSLTLSYSIKYGCVTMQASGYWGYYLFGLENGQIIDHGPQYSGCLGWIDDHRVIVFENPYSTNDYYFYIYDVLMKKKDLISQGKFNND